MDSGTAELLPDPDHPTGWTLRLEGVPQSYVDLADPTRLVFEYQRRLGHVVDLAAPAGRPLRVVHLGGGALTLARYVAATRPRSSQQVMEYDGALVDLVRRTLPLDSRWRIRVRTTDARAGLGRLPDDWADLVVMDAFRAALTPEHLTTAEFVTEVRRVLRSGGWYAANIADGPPLRHLRSQIATVRSVLAEAVLVADPAVLRRRRHGNAVLLAADGPLPVAELTRRAAGDPFPARLHHGRELDDFTGGAAVVTDATAVAPPAPPAAVFDTRPGGRRRGGA